MFLRRSFAPVLTGLLLALSMRGPSTAAETGTGPDNSYCSPTAATDDYVSAAQVAILRAATTKVPPGAAFAEMRDEDRAIVSESLRIGPGGGVFSARLLRDLAIIDAFEQQSACMDSNCPKPAIISGFKTGEKGDPNVDKSWHDLITLWRGFRDSDAAKARACLQVAKSRPDLALTVASNDAVAPARPVSAAESQRPVAPPQEHPTGQRANSKVGGTAVATAAAQPDPGSLMVGCRDSISAALGGRQIRFAKSSAHIGAIDHDFLTKIGPIVTQLCGDAKIAIEGHTDSDGRERFNHLLSLQRAKVVAKAMGITSSSERISIKGRGKAGRVAPNDSRAHKALNRRVEIRVL